MVGKRWRLTDRAKCLYGGNYFARRRENEVDITTGFRVNPKDLESYVRGRIIALIGYIYTLQEK